MALKLSYSVAKQVFGEEGHAGVVLRLYQSMRRPRLLAHLVARWWKVLITGRHDVVLGTLLENGSLRIYQPEQRRHLLAYLVG